jgi:hypothetical protein
MGLVNLGRLHLVLSHLQRSLLAHLHMYYLVGIHLSTILDMHLSVVEHNLHVLEAPSLSCMILGWEVMHGLWVGTILKHAMVPIF